MKAIIAIGTNLNQRDNALSVREYLGGMFGSDIVFTQFMKTKPVDGGDGYYINALVAAIRRIQAMAIFPLTLISFSTETSASRKRIGAVTT